jgi:hypothetical protein
MDREAAYYYKLTSAEWNCRRANRTIGILKIGETVILITIAKFCNNFHVAGTLKWDTLKGFHHFALSGGFKLYYGLHMPGLSNIIIAFYTCLRDLTLTIILYSSNTLLIFFYIF